MSSSSGPNPTAAPPLVDERIVDRRLWSNLVARFGEPVQSAPLTAEEEEVRCRIERRERAIAAVDRGLLASLEGQSAAAERLLSGPVTADLPMALDEHGTIARFDPEAWRLPMAHTGGERELEPSQEIHDCLEVRTPQALLRDLHRLVQEFGDVELRRTAAPTSAAALLRARERVRGALAESRESGMREVTLATTLGRQGMAELAAVLARPWEESRPAHPLPMPSRAPSMEDSQWFGLSGGYDPDA